MQATANRAIPFDLKFFLQHQIAKLTKSFVIQGKPLAREIDIVNIVRPVQFFHLFDNSSCGKVAHGTFIELKITAEGATERATPAGI
jgi:hypothetical protein